MQINQFVDFATNSFTLPDICLRIRGVLDDPRSDAAQIAQLISVDPSLTAKVLKLANSALFRFPSQIESIEKAVSVIGGEALYNLVMAETASCAFAKFDSSLLNQTQYWQECVFRGIVARYLAKQAKVRAGERFFVIGILLEFAALVIAKREPASFKAFIDDNDEIMPELKQHKHFGFTFAQCSGTIMEAWRLPLALYYPVKHLFDEGKSSSDPDIAIVECARRITLRERCGMDSLEIFPANVARALQVEGETLGTAIEFAHAEAAKLSSLIR